MKKLTADALARKTSNEAALRDAIVEGYLETGKPLDATEIAPRVKWSVAKVRRVIADAHGAPDGIRALQDSRASYSKSYRSFQSGAHHVSVYMPTASLLRDMVNNLRTLLHAATAAPTIAFRLCSTCAQKGP